MAKATLIVAALGIFSKLMGFFREQLIAMFFGATGLTDAYMVSLLIPTLVVGMLSGPLSTAFLPVFASNLAKNDQKGSRQVASSVITISTSAVLGISVIAIPFTPYLVRLIAPGFSEDTFANAVALTRVFLPAMAVPLLSALVKAILNSYKEFAIPGISPFVQNLVIVATVALLAPVLGLSSLALATVLGYFSALMVQIPALRKMNLGLHLSLEFNEGLKKVIKLALPLVAGTLFTQLYQLVDKNLASHLPEGSIAALGFADRLRQLPLGLFVTAIVTVIYPSLSEMWAKKDDLGLQETFVLGLRYVEFVCIPAVIGFLVLAKPIVRLVFQRGAFTEGATLLTASALVAYAPGIIAMAAMRLTGVAFYSSHETRLPVLLGIGTALSNILLDIVLVNFLGHVGLALANSIASWIGALLSLYVFHRHISKVPFKTLFHSLSKILASSGIMGAFTWFLADVVGFFEGYGSFRHELVAGFIVIVGSVFVFVVASLLLRCEEITLLLNLVRERIGRKKKKDQK